MCRAIQSLQVRQKSLLHRVTGQVVAIYWIDTGLYHTCMHAYLHNVIIHSNCAQNPRDNDRTTVCTLSICMGATTHMHSDTHPPIAHNPLYTHRTKGCTGQNLHTYTPNRNAHKHSLDEGLHYTHVYVPMEDVIAHKSPGRLTGQGVRTHGVPGTLIGHLAPKIPVTPTGQ